jgi:hypothetical protein
MRRSRPLRGCRAIGKKIMPNSTWWAYWLMNGASYNICQNKVFYVGWCERFYVKYVCISSVTAVLNTLWTTPLELCADRNIGGSFALVLVLDFKLASYLLKNTENASILDSLSTFYTKHVAYKFCLWLTNGFAINCNRHLGNGEVSIILDCYVQIASCFFDVISYLVENTLAQLRRRITARYCRDVCRFACKQPVVFVRDHPKLQCFDKF